MNALFTVPHFSRKSRVLVLFMSQKTFPQSAGVVEYIDCLSANGKTLPTMSVLDMTLDIMLVRFQLGLWGMPSSPSLPLLPGLLRPRMVVPDGVLSMGQG